MAKPTLLIDEADTFMSNNEELRGVVNAGHRADGSILRVVGDTHEPRRFKVFGPCAIAGIKSLPATIADRSIHVRMARKTKGEKVRSFRADRTEVPDRMRAMLARFAADNTTRLITIDPELPAGAFNRFADNWRPLAAIAEAAAGTWPAAARAAILVDLGAAEDDELGQLLLADIRHLFDTHFADASSGRPADKLKSKFITIGLNEMTDRPWSEFGKSERPLSENKLASLLKAFGIKSGDHRFPSDLPGGPEKTAKGYERIQFVEVWNRYLSPESEIQSATTQQPRKTAAYSDFQSATNRPLVALSNAPKAAENLDCCGVAFWNGGSGEKNNGFAPSTEWQDMPDGFVAPGGCDFRINLTTGRRQVRIAADLDDPPPWER